MNEYDRLVSVYDEWSAADPASSATLRFYVDLCLGMEGSVVELGVGHGRIALELAKLGKRVIGIDISESMLRELQKRARERGVSDLIHIINTDIRHFQLPEPANLIILPFRTFGHLLSLEDKMSGLRQIYKQLKPGGIFVFDHYVINTTWARNHHGVPKLMCKIIDNNTGNYRYIWDTYLYDFQNQIMDCTITIEEADVNGNVLRRQHAPLSFSWVDPAQVREIFDQVGFQVNALFGSFMREPFGENSKEQIWLASKPE